MNPFSDHSIPTSVNILGLIFTTVHIFIFKTMLKSILN